jgi:hypothetical protein
VAEVLKVTGGGAQISVDAVGHSSVIESCVKATARFGQIVLLGTPRAEVQGNLTPVFQDIHLRCLVVRGALLMKYPVRTVFGSDMTVEWTFETIFDLILRRRLDVRPLISHVIGPDAAPAAYHGLQHERSTYTAVVIDWRTHGNT